MMGTKEREIRRNSGDDVIDTSQSPALRTPGDVMSLVFSQLDCVDLLNCSLVCKQWYIESQDLREDWKNEYMETSLMYCLGIKHDSHPPNSYCSIRGLHCWCP